MYQGQRTQEYDDSLSNWRGVGHETMSRLTGVVHRLLPFLRSQPPLEDDTIEHILIVGSGSPLNIGRAVASMRQRFPAARLALLAARSSQRAPDRAHLDANVEWSGLATLARVRRESPGGYDLKLVLLTGEGQMLLKLLSFALPARRMLVFTEGGGFFGWSFDERLAIWNHIKWRLGGGLPVQEIARRLWRALTNPLLALAAFIVLLLWHAGLLVQRMLGRRRIL